MKYPTGPLPKGSGPIVSAYGVHMNDGIDALVSMYQHGTDLRTGNSRDDLRGSVQQCARYFGVHSDLVVLALRSQGLDVPGPPDLYEGDDMHNLLYVRIWLGLRPDNYQGHNRWGQLRALVESSLQAADTLLT